ncbi:FAD/NAD(P) dependent oxidoreductase [Oleiphilus messinensis]|uniref:FAD/NAD(P) dependent oxidoreductase n=1 Tax=Oleiphilus messinensis TaxID=141451 RepID=A0A1Y0I4J2_9GAMM|nr:FAD/NAD(P) dependent oxidoreductase [Oleiphilus messinensis]
MTTIKTTTTKATKNKMTPSTLRIGTRYRAGRLNGPYDAIIIGSGMGGLTTAACLSKAGKKVLVLEQHYTAGGFTHSYARNGYEWDVGVHYIGDMGYPTIARKLFDYVTNSQLQWAPMDSIYDRFYFGSEHYDLKAGKENFVECLAEHFPEERSALEKYVAMLDKINSLVPVFSADKLMPEVLAKAYNLAKWKLLPAYFDQTTYEALSTITRNEKLIQVLCGQWGDCGVPPRKSSFLIHALIAKHYIHGGYYPVGGASRIAETMIPVIQEGGGDVLTYADVKKICAHNGKVSGVVMADGHIIPCDTIISNAGVFNTFDRLLPQNLVQKYGYDHKLKTVQPSMSHLGMYIGLKETAQELNLPKTNFWIYPDYSPEQNIETFLNDKESEFPVVYVSFPSAKDPSWQKRYPGTATIEIVAPTHYDWFAPWKDKVWGKRGKDYDQLKTGFEQRLLEILYQKLPQLRGKIDYYETSTPLSTDYFCAYRKGEIYGLEHDPDRFKQTWLRPKTRIPGLYLTGQDILTCGIVGALMAGVGTAQSILGLKGLKLINDLRTNHANYSEGAFVVSSTS